MYFLLIEDFNSFHYIDPNTNDIITTKGYFIIDALILILNWMAYLTYLIFVLEVRYKL